MSNLVPTFKLKNGMEIPAVGLGTSMLRDPQKVVELAIDNGYRLIDTAQFYKTECQIGAAIRNKINDGTIRREDMFIITKLWTTFHHPDHVTEAMVQSLRELQLEYVDAFLMHSPLASKKTDDDYETIRPEEADIPIEVTWKAMEKLVTEGFTKCIGVSNFNRKQLDRIIVRAKYFPVINEIEVNPFFREKPLLEYCQSKRIQIVAYAPFYSPGNPRLPSDEDIPLLVTLPIITSIARKHDKTPGQIIIRWLYQLGCVPIPKSDCIEHVKQNINIFGSWEGLDAEDMAKMDDLDIGKRRFSFDQMARKSVYLYGHIGKLTYGLICVTSRWGKLTWIDLYYELKHYKEYPFKEYF